MTNPMVKKGRNALKQWWVEMVGLVGFLASFETLKSLAQQWVPILFFLLISTARGDGGGCFWMFTATGKSRLLITQWTLSCES